MLVTVKLLEAKEIPALVDAFAPTVWKTPAEYFQWLLAKQQKSERVFLLAYLGNHIAGFVTIKWQSGYPAFVEKGIPEINDLHVLPEFRRRGVAAALMDEAEQRAFERSPVVGLAVGLYADYGPAQLMYNRRGYVLDGLGLFYENEPVKPGTSVFVDDNLLLYMTKERF